MNALNIWKKEMKVGFGSPMAYVIFTTFFIITGYVFNGFSLSIAKQSIAYGTTNLPIVDQLFRPLTNHMAVILLFLIPAITMRLFAEEKKTGTIDLLYTYPVRDSEILIGKFLGAVSLLLFLLVPTLLYPLLVKQVVPVEWSVIISQFIGLFFLGTCYIAVGLWASNTTDNQIVAAVLTLGALLGFWLLGWLTQTFPTALWAKILGQLSILGHFDGFSKGVLNTADITFFIVFIVFFMAAALNGLNIRLWRGSAVNLLFLLGIFVLAQLISMAHPKEWDFTKNKRYSLSPLTKTELQEVRGTLELWAFVEPSDQQMRDLLHQYAIASKNVQLHFVDPRSEPAKAREFGINSAPPVVVLKLSNREEQVSPPDEEKITNAVYRLSAGVVRTIYFTSGHGEPDIQLSDPTGYARLREVLSGENFTVKTLEGFKDRAIPADADAVIVIDPHYAPLPEEGKALARYVKSGGHLLFLYGFDTPKEWTAVLNRFGFKIGQNIVTDPAIPVFGGGGEFLATNTFNPHPITDPFLSTTNVPPILLPMTRSVGSAKKTPKTVTVTPVINTSRFGQAFAVKASGKKIVPVSKTPSEKGMIPVASVAVINGKKSGRIAVIGSSVFADNQWFNNSATLNKDFLLNTIGWLTESQNTIAIHPKSAEYQPFYLDPQNRVRFTMLSLIALPGFGILAGFTTWLRRRNL